MLIPLLKVTIVLAVITGLLMLSLGAIEFVILDALIVVACIYMLQYTRANRRRR
jgi:hypothetical protein